MTPARRLQLELDRINQFQAHGAQSSLDQRCKEIRTLLPDALQLEREVGSRQSNRFMMYFLGWCAVLAGLALYWIALRGETAGWLAVGWIGYGIWKAKEHDDEFELVFQTNSAWEKRRAEQYKEAEAATAKKVQQ